MNLMDEQKNITQEMELPQTGNFEHPPKKKMETRRWLVPAMIIIILFLLVGVGYFANTYRHVTGPIAIPSPVLGVTINTDKTEYKQGGIVEITVKNVTGDTEMKICNPFYTVEKLDDQEWVSIRRLLCPCGALCKQAAYTVLDPTKATKYEWKQKEEWCDDSTKNLTTVSQQVQTGKYRIKSYVGPMEAECREIYSDEFILKNSL